MAYGRINITILREEVLRNGAIDEAATEIIRDKFDEAKAEMLAEFDQHPVTREIEAGPTANNISETLEDAEVPGNLSAFLGFDGEDGGADAISELRNLIEESTRLNVIPVRQNNNTGVISYRFTGKVMTPDEVYDVTPVNWGDTARGRSWVSIIENGTNSFTYYLYKRWEQGRSQEALQAKTRSGQLIVVNQGDFRTTPYTTKIIKDFVQSVGTSTYP